MRVFIYILIFVAAFTSVNAQVNVYCHYDQLAAQAFKNKELEKARLLIDSAINNCEKLAADPYSYYVKGFIYKEIDLVEKKPDSETRKEAVDAFLKSIELDTAKTYLTNNMAAIKNIATRYFNESVPLMDTNNYLKALAYFEKYKALTKVYNPEFDFTQKDIMLNNVMAVVYKEKYLNNKEQNGAFLDSSIANYERTIQLDENNYSAYYNLGVIYYNKGVDLVLSLDDEVDLMLLIDAQEKQLEYLQKALPYLKKAYAIKPSKEIVEGFRGVYLSMGDDEKYQFYSNELKKFDSKE